MERHLYLWSWISQPNATWHHYADPTWMTRSSESSVGRACSHHLDYVQTISNTWQSKIRIPEAWTSDCSFNPDLDEWSFDVGNVARMTVAIRAITDGNVSRCTDAQLQAEHGRVDSVLQDFLLYKTSQSVTLDRQSRFYLQPFVDIIFYQGGERAAEATLPSILASTPGTYLTISPHVRCPGRLATTFDRCGKFMIDFALVVDQPASLEPEELDPNDPEIDAAYIDQTPESKSRPQLQSEPKHISSLRPAVLIGIKGPQRWTNSADRIHTSLSKQASTLEESLCDLSKVVESSLATHVVNYFLKNNVSLSQPSLPAWLIMFGVIYDASHVHIVAHIPYFSSNETENATLKYLACIVDTIPFAAPPDHPSPTDEVQEEWATSRMRVGLALMALKRHAKRLADEWKEWDTVWSTSFQELVVGYEEAEVGEPEGDISDDERKKFTWEVSDDEWMEAIRAGV